MPANFIREIQGASQRSPFVGTTVSNIQGVVTAIIATGAGRGFYFQDPNPDSDNATSEGIFVFLGSTWTPPGGLAIGSSVQVAGLVEEFRRGGNGGDPNNLTVTQINANASGGSVAQIASIGSITPTVIGSGGRVAPTSVINNDFVTGSAGNVETSGDFDPTTEGIDFYESLEGMLVQINNPRTTSPTNSSGEIWVLPDGGIGATGVTARGGSIVSPTDFNPERIQIDDMLLGAKSPAVDVGAQLGTVTGIVDYSFSNYEVLATTLPTVFSPSALTREVTALKPSETGLAIATFNVENLDPNDGATKFNTLASRIVTNLGAPDIISLEEVQDNNGATNDAGVDATTTYSTLIAAIQASGGPAYEFRQINPTDDQDGGEPGGNIRVGFLFNPQRVQFVDRPGGTSTSNTTINTVDGKPQLSASPGRIDPTNAAFAASRKPLVGEFVFNGKTIFVVGNHFNSKGGDQPLYGPNQPPTLSSEVQRRQQAQLVNDFVDGILAVDVNANVIVLGDLNDFPSSEPLNILKGTPGGSGTAVLRNLIETLPANEQYTYNFQGNAQVLDQILVSNGLFAQLNGYDVVHVNSEFTDQVSDHDPSVARFTLGEAIAPQPQPLPQPEPLPEPLPKSILGTPGNDRLNGTSDDDVIEGLAGNDVLKGVAGNDVLIGQKGKDLLVGGLGSDRLTGGTGKDTFIFQQKDEAGDTITDFSRGDVLKLVKLLNRLNYKGSDPVADGYLRFRQAAANTLVQLDMDGSKGGEGFSNLTSLLNVKAATLEVGRNVLV
jgi:uncharacterized protein